MQTSFNLNMGIVSLQEGCLQLKKHHIRADSDIYALCIFPKLLLHQHTFWWGEAALPQSLMQNPRNYSGFASLLHCLLLLWQPENIKINTYIDKFIPSSDWADILFCLRLEYLRLFVCVCTESVYYTLKRKQEKNINFQNERQTEQTPHHNINKTYGRYQTEKEAKSKLDLVIPVPIRVNIY